MTSSWGNSRAEKRVLGLRAQRLRLLDGNLEATGLARCVVGISYNAC